MGAVYKVTDTDSSVSRSLRGRNENSGGVALVSLELTKAFYVDVNMGEAISGDFVPPEKRGVITSKLADCTVMAGARWTGKGWEEWFFAHTNGGIVDGPGGVSGLPEVERIVGGQKKSDFFVVLGAKTEYGNSLAFEYVTNVLMIPDSQIEKYVSETMWTFALLFDEAGTYGQFPPGIWDMAATVAPAPRNCRRCQLV